MCFHVTIHHASLLLRFFLYFRNVALLIYVQAPPTPTTGLFVKRLICGCVFVSSTGVQLIIRFLCSGKSQNPFHRSNGSLGIPKNGLRSAMVECVHFRTPFSQHIIFSSEPYHLCKMMGGEPLQIHNNASLYLANSSD